MKNKLLALILLVLLTVGVADGRSPNPTPSDPGGPIFKPTPYPRR